MPVERRKTIPIPTLPTFEWRSQSRADLVKIVAYIAEDNPDAAQAFKAEIEAEASALLKRLEQRQNLRIVQIRQFIFLNLKMP